MESRWTKVAVDESDVRHFLMEDYPRLVAGLTLASGSRAGAEDAVQEALARAWDRSDRGLHIHSLSAWVTVVALNLARSGLRRRRAERRATDRLRDPGRHEEGTPSGASSRSDERVDLERALSGLSPRQREAIVLHYYLDLPIADIAKALGVAEGTVKTTLHRARASLAEALGASRDNGRVDDRAE
jgi:RNA polymerase sigma-70 factor (ECF subfamily)